METTNTGLKTLYLTSERIQLSRGGRSQDLPTLAQKAVTHFLLSLSAQLHMCAPAHRGLRCFSFLRPLENS